jgi:hypothetical protein
MGTNYFLQGKACDSCGHVEIKKHIGKSSLGWEFHFRGYRELSIVSIEDWENECADERKVIVDEYGEKIEKVEFFRRARASKEEHALLNQYNVTVGQPQTEREKKYCETRHNQHGYCSDRPCWKDNAGYAFTDCDFS